MSTDLSDAAEAGVGGVSPHALNYSTLGASTPTQGGDPALSSTETLLRNIQGLLKVAADNARQQERQINYEKGRNLCSSGYGGWELAVLVSMYTFDLLA